MTDLYDIKEIEREVHEIIDFACGHGIKSIVDATEYPISRVEFLKRINASKSSFISSVHDGFKIAQTRIISCIHEIQAEEQLISSKIKEAKSKRDNELIKKLKGKEKHLENIQILFKHCADAILWQLIKEQLYISRRLFQNVEGSKKLKNINLISVQAVVDDVNKKPENFLLITDITNNAQVGDVIGFMDGKFIIGEVKEGKKNIEVLEVLSDLENEKTTIEAVEEKYAEDQKFIKQLKRNIKQKKTLRNVTKIINEDKGVDPVTNNEVKIITPKENTPLYIERLSALEKQLNERNYWAYDVIDDCLHIGIYKGEKRFIGSYLLKSIAEQSGSDKYIIVDVLKTIGSLNKPIFFLPFSPDLIFDILFSRVKVYYMLELESFFKLYPEFGLKAEWASTKETAKAKNGLGKNHEIFTYKNQGVKITLQEEGDFEVWLSHGSFLRIFFEHIYPSYIAYMTYYY